MATAELPEYISRTRLSPGAHTVIRGTAWGLLGLGMLGLGAGIRYDQQQGRRDPEKVSNEYVDTAIHVVNRGVLAATSGAILLLCIEKLPTQDRWTFRRKYKPAA